jgi:hypothetical protein
MQWDPESLLSGNNMSTIACSYVWDGNEKEHIKGLVGSVRTIGHLWWHYSIFGRCERPWPGRMPVQKTYKNRNSEPWLNSSLCIAYSSHLHTLRLVKTSRLRLRKTVIVIVIVINSILPLVLGYRKLIKRSYRWDALLRFPSPRSGIA